MSLTDDWKSGRLTKGNRYYVLTSVGKIYPKFYSMTRGFRGDIKQVLAPVPSYEELQGLKEDNKRMAYDLGNQGCRIKNQRHEINNRLKEIQSLRDLLKECREKIHQEFICSDYLSIDKFFDLITRINATIGESEE